MEKIIDFITSKNVHSSIITVVAALFIYFILRKVISKIDKKKIVSKKKKTIIRLFNNILKYIVIILTILVLLQLNGINVTSIIAGLSIVSLVAGLALQDALKDIIMGINLIMDDYFSVGDVIAIDNLEGKVIELGIKATKLQNIDTGAIITISNRNISNAIVKSNWFDIDLPLPYEESLDTIKKLLDEIIKESKKLDQITNIEYKGPNKFDSSSINYKLRIYTKPELIPQTKRDVNSIIKEELDKFNISVPYTQIRL